MLKQKYFIVTGVVIALAGLLGGGYWFVSRQPRQKVNDGMGSSFVATQAQAAAGAGTSGQNIPLTPAPSNGLNTDSSPTAGSLGQLSGNQNASGTSSSAAATSSSSSSAPSVFDPSTFSQYGKYQNSDQALFADVQAGSGTELTSGHQASVYYKGWLTNGELFDQSLANASGQLQPFTFSLGAHQVIPGWEEGLAGMKVGGTRLLIVPPSVGYAASGQGSIPPNAVLVFEVQLIGVQ